MLGFNNSNWAGHLGLKGIPGMMQTNQMVGSQFLGNMMPRQPQGPGGGDGSNDEWLAALMAGGGGGGGGSSGGLYGGSGNYLGGSGLI
jgi:hypothetical protein